MDSTALMALIESRDQYRDEAREAHLALARFATQIAALVGFEVTQDTNTNEIAAAVAKRLDELVPKDQPTPMKARA